ncbi:hypothetical protein F442_15228 [Phytophthora nicotianae P10297]|uniref:Macro domain-containing protein n=1 Tax=Phytophthora nicotianae P10297 TaxID=1317064 RepID=W2YQI7_PHYNI|nr:hypothetical protein F442_15228 [Phytophthora nicotianae P10297]
MVRIKHKFSVKWPRVDLEGDENSDFNFGSDEDEVASKVAAVAAVVLPALNLSVTDAQQQDIVSDAHDLLQSAVKRQREGKSWETQGHSKEPRLESKVLMSSLNRSGKQSWGRWMGKPDNLQRPSKMRAPTPVPRLAANVIDKGIDFSQENSAELIGKLPSPVVKGPNNERPKIIVMRGDPTDWSTAAIVSDTNSLLHHKSGLAATIVRKGGWGIQRQCSEWIYYNGEVPVGSAMWTTAGNLSSKYIIYTVGPNVSIHRSPMPHHQLELRCAVRSALNEADSLGVSSVAMPALCTGVCRYPKYLAAREIVTECLEFCDECSLTSLRLIVLMNEDEVTTSIFVRALNDTRQQRQLERQATGIATMSENEQTLGDGLDASDSSSTMSDVEEST